MAFNAWADLLLAFGNRFEIPLSLTELYSHTAKAILGEQLYALQRAVAGRRQPKELQSTEAVTVAPGQAGLGFDSPEGSFSAGTGNASTQNKPLPAQTPAPGPAGDAYPLVAANSWDGEGNAEDRYPTPNFPSAMAALVDGGATAKPHKPDVPSSTGRPVESVPMATTRGPRTVALLDEDAAAAHESPASQTQTFTGTSRRKQKQLQEATKEGQMDKQTKKYAVEKELVLDELQEITDSGKEDITMQVADAPKVHKTQHIQSLRELELVGLSRLKGMMGGHPGETSVDLSLLTRCLIAEDLAFEEDLYWDEELLLTEMASELQSDREGSAALVDQLGAEERPSLPVN